MMKYANATTILATLTLGFGVAGCGNNGGVTLTPPPPPNVVSYIQIERLSRPAIKEVFEPFQDHQKSNAVEPYADPTILADIKTTEDAVRYGPTGPAAGTPDYGAALQGILYPDEYSVNLAGATPAGNDPEYFLSNEVEKAFGGRAPNDDVSNSACSSETRFRRSVSRRTIIKKTRAFPRRISRGARTPRKRRPEPSRTSRFPTKRKLAPNAPPRIFGSWEAYF
jgi:hypothetical protein